MAKIKQTVFDSGPIIHISEINKQICFSLFKKIFISKEVSDELNFLEAPGKEEIKKTKNIFQECVDSKHKDITKILIGKYGLDLGEASSIALCKQKSIKLFFTDDLSARLFGKKYGLNVHGTIGILTRCFREKILSKQEAIQTLKSIKKESSLFITSDIIAWTIKEINKF